LLKTLQEFKEIYQVLEEIFEYTESNIKQNKLCLRFENWNYTIIKKISFSEKSDWSTVNSVN